MTTEYALIYTLDTEYSIIFSMNTEHYLMSITLNTILVSINLNTEQEGHWALGRSSENDCL